MVTVKEQKEKEEQYLKDQSEYNKTGDTNILWFKMEPFIREMAQSMLKKMVCCRLPCLTALVGQHM